MPKSKMPGCVWPAVPSAHGAALLAVLFQLEQSQWWPAERLRELQFKQARELLTHAAAHSPFYRERFRAAGLDPSSDDLANAWQSIPILTRRDVQQHGRSIDCDKLPPQHGQTSQQLTSGSTGTPVAVRQSELHHFMWRVIGIRDALWHRRDFTHKFAAIRSETETSPEGRAWKVWSGAQNVVFQTGPSVLLHSNTDIEEQRRWLLREEPQILLTLPTNLRALAKSFARSGDKLPSLCEVRTMGEVCGDDLHDLCLATWGVPLHDIYSGCEVGYMARQCPEHRVHHVDAETILLEVLDDEGRPCAPGEIGRVVVTPLHNFATPLIRYEVGDYAEVGSPCACGRGLPVLRRVLGRQRSMIHLPDGRTHWPTLPEEVWAHVAPIQQMQVVQRTLDSVEARLVMPRELTADEAATLTRNLQKCLGYPFRMSFVRVDAIARQRNGKFEDFISMVGRGTPEPGDPTRAGEGVPIVGASRG